MTDLAALLVLAAASAALRIACGGALPPFPAPKEIVPGSAIKAGYPGEWVTWNP